MIAADRFVIVTHILALHKCLLLVLVLAVAPSSRLHAQAKNGAGASKKAWRSVWAARESEIVSARLAYRRFSHNELKPLSADEVRKLFRQSDFGGEPKELARFVNAILSVPHPSNEPWSSKTFTMEGSKTKDADTRRTIVFDGANRLVEEKNNKKITVGREPGPVEYHYKLNDFRTIVPSNYSRSIQRISEIGSTQIMFEFGRTVEKIDFEAVVDKASGLPVEFIERKGNYYVLILQDDFVLTPSGINFPMVRGSFRFQLDNTLQSATVDVMSDVELNLQLSEDHFALSTGDSSRVHDYRSGSKEIYVVPEKEAEVLEFVKQEREQREKTKAIKAQIQAAMRPSAESGGGSNRHLFIVGNVVFLCLLSLGFWLRSRSKNGIIG